MVGQALHTELDGTPAELDVANGVERVGEAHAPRTADKLPKGHHDRVSALAYSPDGAYIVSGSYDCTLRIWDARTGRMVGQPLEGHTGLVLSVSFSPDGTHVASGSRDNSIRIWGVRNCTMFGAPLTGHFGLIASVSYSPDGAHIASGSRDNTIRIWDAYTGQMVGSPLILGHTGGVNSVSYSPCGAFLVSGSDNRTIRVWNTQTGRIVGRPLRGHAYLVGSVAYSPDGLYIVARSLDTVCVWDAYTGNMIGKSREFRYNQFHSVSYSSAGRNLSFSYLNRAIYISHVHTDWNLGQSFKLNSSEASSTSCVFSPDGTQIASGYKDGTIRVSSIHIQRVLDAEMRSHGNRPCAVKPCTCSNWDTWELDNDGWAVMGNSQKLIWVPPYLHKSLQLPHNTAMMSRDGALKLDFSSAKLGESWSECYTL
ncbi:hypothetical protein FRC12_016703 [Ceratobasidium sp. 428]|nr:hypothetical protein FRC12_016703 [Ceratobasidium sp. 428]